MKGRCVCCGQLGDVGGTPLTCLGCTHCGLDFDPHRQGYVPGRYCDTHGVACDQLEPYVDDSGYIAWRRRIPTTTPQPGPDGQLAFDLRPRGIAQ